MHVPPREYAPDITIEEMFWRAMRTPLDGADSNVERFMLGVATSWVRAGDFVVDLGANHGQHARVLGRALGAGGRLLLVEADPALAEGLRLGAARSAITIQVVNAAVSDSSAREVVFLRHPIRDQEGSLYRREDVPYEEVKVPTTSVDDLLAGQPSPRFVKIDVEGAEFSVLRGAASMLRDTTPLIACETSFDSQIESPLALDYSLRDLIALLDEAEWGLFLLDGTRVALKDIDDPDLRVHYQCWLAKRGSAAEVFLEGVLPGLVTAFAWGSTDTPPYPFHLDKHPIG